MRARCELDLRLGAAFTRLQTLTLQNEYEGLDGIMSYGPCQFPTMWFVVQRAKRIEAFLQASANVAPLPGACRNCCYHWRASLTRHAALAGIVLVLRA